MSTKVVLNIHVHPDEAEFVKRLASLYGWTLTAAVRYLIREAMRQGDQVCECSHELREHMSPNTACTHTGEAECECTRFRFAKPGQAVIP